MTPPRPTLAVVLATAAAIGCGAPAPAPPTAPEPIASTAPNPGAPTEPAPRMARSVRDAVALAVLREATALTDVAGDEGLVPWENDALAMLVASRDTDGLRALLEDAEPTVQSYALVGLAEVDPAAFAAALPAFRDRRDPVTCVRRYTSSTLPMAEVARQLEDPDVRGQILPTWPTPDPAHVEAGRTPAEWVERLARRDTSFEAEDALRRCGRRALPALIAGLEHEDVRVRRAVARRLRALGPQAFEAVGPMARTLEHDPDPETRLLVASALAWVGPWAVEAAPALLRAVSPDADLWLFQPEAQLDAIQALKVIAYYVPDAVDASALSAATLRAIERGLDDPELMVRSWALKLLERVPATPEVGQLVARRARALHATHERVMWFFDMWKRVPGHEALVDLARAALVDPAPDMQRVAVRALLDAGQRALVEAALADVRARGDDDPRAIVLAAHLDPSQAPPELVAALRPGTSWERLEAPVAAAERCEAIGVAALLVEVLKGPDPTLRHAARTALRDTRPWPDLIAAHAELLDDPAPITRVSAAEVVLLLEERHGTPLHSSTARAVLAEALADTSDPVARRRALEALRDPHPLRGATLEDFTDPELSPWTRLALASTVLEWGPKEEPTLLAARDALAELVSKGTDPGLRRAAIFVLRNHREASWCRRFEEDLDPVVRVHANTGSLLGEDGAVEHLARIVEALPAVPANVRAGALERLVEKAGDADEAPALRDALLEAFLGMLDAAVLADDPELLEGAVKGLEYLGVDALGRGLDRTGSRPAVALMAVALDSWVRSDHDLAPAQEALERAIGRERDPRLRYLLVRVRETPREGPRRR